MVKTFCGKSCETCVQMQNQVCPGCEEGPGRLVAGDCALAKCCRDKGCTTCAACEQNAACSMLRGPENLPEHRLDQLAARASKRASVLRKWLWILFWLMIGLLILNRFLAFLEAAKLLPYLSWLSAGVGIIYYAAYGLILLRISSECGHYRIAGVCWLVATALNIAAFWLSSTVTVQLGARLLLYLPQLVLLMIGCYHEFSGHAEVVGTLDFELSYKWTRLWTWYIVLLVGTVFAVLFTAFLPLLGGLLLLAVLISAVVLVVFRFVYLYQTARLFRFCPPQEMYRYR